MAPPEFVAIYKRHLAGYGARLGEGLAHAWDDLTFDDGSIDPYTAKSAPLFNGMKTLAVATSAAFFALALGSRPVGVAAGDVNVEPRVTDPFLAAWHALKEGRSIEEAIQAGRSAAQASGFDFVQSTARRTGDHVARASGKQVRWTRVPSGDACAWCQLVAGQTYHSAESADFGHDRCGCAAVPE